jgi:hypothetical protein
MMPLRPSSLAPIPPALDSVLLIALAKSRDARFASAGELTAAFRAAAAGILSDDLAHRARQLSRLQPWAEPEARAASPSPSSPAPTGATPPRS